MSIKSRVVKLEVKKGGGLHVVHGTSHDSEEEDIKNYCKEHNVDRCNSIVLWMSPEDVGTL